MNLLCRQCEVHFEGDVRESSVGPIAQCPHCGNVSQYEPCGNCGGSGGTPDHRCSKCLGHAYFVVRKDEVVQEEKVNHPAHYGGDTTYEAIKVIEAWQLGFCLGNTVKYISRAGKKDPSKTIEDLEKAEWYLQREIARLKDGR